MDSNFHAIRYFLKYAGKYKVRLFLYFITIWVYTASKVIPIYMVRNFLDIIINTRKFDGIKYVVALVSCAGVLLGLFSYFFRYLSHYISVRITVDVKNSVYAHFTSLPLSYFESQEKGDLITRMTHDSTCVSQLIKKIFVAFIPKPIESIGYIITGFTISWRLALFFFLVIPLMGILVKNFGSKISRRSLREKAYLSESTVTMEQFFYAIKLVKSFHQHGREEEKFRNVNKEFIKARMSTARAQSRSVAFLELWGGQFFAFMVALGGYMIFKEYIKATDFMAFLFALAASLTPIREAGRELLAINSLSPSAARLFEVIQTKNTITVPSGAVEIDSIEPGIQFEDVRFSYEKDEVIKGVTLDIEPGQMVSFVGPSGGGKTTLLDLIPRFYDIDSGSIKIGGQDIREIKPDSLMSKIAIVLQDSFIFNSSAFENIRYGLPDATFEDVKQAAQAAHIHETIEKFPGGYDHFLGEGGSSLSGGQKQRISIARALLKGAPILIMDEPTSDLDSESEKYIIDTLETLRDNQMIILTIAHRLSTVLHSDKIVVIRDGQIEAAGSHEELLESSPTYKRMYEVQFQDKF